MRTVITILSSLIFMAALPTVDAVTAPDHPESRRLQALPSPVEPVIVTPEHTELIEWALDRFTEAGLPLGGVEIGVYDDPAPCRGYRGLHVAGTVSVCATHTNPQITDTWRRHTLLHELAHAWAEQHVTQEQRDEFTAARQTATWEDAGFDWADRAAEHAAEIVAWAIADFPLYPHVALTERDCAGLAAGYRFLTGSEPPRGFTDHCD